ncbi:MAG: LEA type 2 family protein [Steroidobacteraceae bacterium]|jgi:LEA14-like dessication related protein|nr:LEA type 2 family protein [Steroidobacteraceae bacterium]
MKSWVLGGVAATLAACTAFAPKLETPKLSIVNVELVKGDLFEQRLRARIKVENPNDRELAVKGITYTIEVGGEEFGRGISGSSFTVPRLGEAEFDMNVTANMAGTLMRLATRAREAGSAPDAIDYRIVGKVSLATGMLRSIPFEERGRFKLR